MNSDRSENLMLPRLSASLLPLLASHDQLAELHRAAGILVHRFRNLLNGLRMNLFLLRRGGGNSRAELVHLEGACASIELLLDRFQQIYRTPCLRILRCPLGRLVSDRVGAWQEMWKSGGGVLEVDSPPVDLEVDFDPTVVTQALDAFVAWRLESRPAGGVARLSWRSFPDRIHVNWSELAAGFDGACRGLGASPRGAGRVDTLALPLLARVAVLHGGSWHLGPGPEFEFSIEWPRFQPKQLSS